MSEQKMIHVKDKEDVVVFNFVLSAMGKDEYRKYFHAVKCDGNRLIATDGKRLHIATMEESFIEKYSFEDGFYFPVSKSKKVCILQKIDFQEGFPNIDRVIPAIEDEEKNIDVCFGKKNGLETVRAVSQIVKSLPEDKTVSFEFLYDIPKDLLCTVSFYGGTKPIRIETSDQKMRAYIMPVQLN